MSKNWAGVVTADDRKIRVILGEDNSLISTITEVKGNSDVGAAVVVDILDVVGGTSSVNWVTVISGVGVNKVRRGTSDDGLREVGLHTGSGTEDLTQRVDDGNVETGILGSHDSTRAVDTIVDGVVVPVNVGTEDSTTGQLFHQISSAPFRLEVDASEGFKTVDSLATFGGATLFEGRDGSEDCKSRDDLSEDHC